MGIDAATFYQSGRIAVLNCDFYFPGTGRSGDLPPRAGFAERWHPQLLALMPDIQLTLLVGSYAVRAQLGLPASAKLGDISRIGAPTRPNDCHWCIRRPATAPGAPTTPGSRTRWFPRCALAWPRCCAALDAGRTIANPSSAR